ncbi:hypothetical protein M1O20_03570 [Dehalococcoidia bacterium]|nr:hypothetical protein [Dehalococcoidia bacterium]
MLRQARRLLEEPTGLIGGSERSQDGMKRAGLASLLAQEAILAMGAARGQEPVVRDGFSYNGPVAGERVRSLGIRLLDGRLAGLALISGTPGSSEVAVRLVHQFHSKGLLLSNLQVFHLSLGPLDEHGLTALAGSIACGFPVVTDVDSPWADFTPSGLFSFPFDRLSGEDDLQKAETLADRCLDLGGIKGIVLPTPAIPVEYGTEFEGETISADDLQVEFKGFEWLNMRDMAEVKDGDIKVVGPEIEETGPEVPMGLLVEIAGRRMKKEFEAVLERRILHLISGAEGVQYEGQRDRMRIRHRGQDTGCYLHRGRQAQPASGAGPSSLSGAGFQGGWNAGRGRGHLLQLSLLSIPHPLSSLHYHPPEAGDMRSGKFP